MYGQNVQLHVAFVVLTVPLFHLVQITRRIVIGYRLPLQEKVNFAFPPCLKKAKELYTNVLNFATAVKMQLVFVYDLKI